MTTKNKRFVRIAIKHAKQSKHPYRVGAVVVKGGRIISAACNRHKTDPGLLQMKDLNYNALVDKLHAELAAINRINVENASIYVVRLNSFDELALARPCPMCMVQIRGARIKQIYYSNAEGELIMERLRV